GISAADQWTGWVSLPVTTRRVALLVHSALISRKTNVGSSSIGPYIISLQRFQMDVARQYDVFLFYWIRMVHRPASFKSRNIALLAGLVVASILSGCSGDKALVDPSGDGNQQSARPNIIF